MWTDCWTVFLDGLGGLSQSISYRGPTCVLASSGLAHYGNTKETEWKWNTLLAIKEGFQEFGTFCGLWLSPCRCHPLGSRAAPSDGPLCCFWTSQCIVHCARGTLCCSLTSTPKHALRQRPASEVTPAHWMARTAGPRRHHDGAITPKTKHLSHNVGSGSLRLQQGSFLSQWLLVSLTNIRWMPMTAPVW